MSGAEDHPWPLDSCCWCGQALPVADLEAAMAEQVNLIRWVLATSAVPPFQLLDDVNQLADWRVAEMIYRGEICRCPRRGITVAADDELPQRGFVLYRLWDEHNRLLYVGISTRPQQRLRAHCRTQEWADQITLVTHDDRFQDQVSLLAAEREAIISEHPAFNKDIIR